MDILGSGVFLIITGKFTDSKEKFDKKDVLFLNLDRCEFYRFNPF